MAKLTTDEIIDKIAEIRTNNNWRWMDLLRLAFEIAPERARDIMKEIQLNDKEISKWLGKL